MSDQSLSVVAPSALLVLPAPPSAPPALWPDAFKSVLEPDAPGASCERSSGKASVMLLNDAVRPLELSVRCCLESDELPESAIFCRELEHDDR